MSYRNTAVLLLTLATLSTFAAAIDFYRTLSTLCNMASRNKKFRFPRLLFLDSI